MAVEPIHTAGLLDRCLARIRECDAEIRAWTVVDPRPATGDGPLSGVPFGAKDIIDTAGMPTEFGSALYAGRVPERDAAIVAELRRAGAVLVGKTATTAFASFDPAPTRNPRAPDRTPGGSSSGSAAAVAAGMVPFALGSQTMGSVLRPASFCGVCGFKPTFGRLPTEGVLGFAPSLDTLGLFTPAAADMQTLWADMHGGAARTESSTGAACLDLPVEPAMQTAFHDAVRRLRAAGFGIRDLEPPDGFGRLIESAAAINDYEGARTQERLWRDHGDAIGVKLAALVVRGLAMSRDEYQAALGVVEEMRRVFRGVFQEHRMVLTPAAMGPPPAGLGSTGDPARNAPWTALRTPAVSIPLPVDGPPLGLQIVAEWDGDEGLLAAAADIERLLS